MRLMQRIDQLNQKVTTYLLQTNYSQIQLLVQLKCFVLSKMVGIFKVHNLNIALNNSQTITSHFLA
jgi:hypothetical protein